MSGPMGRHWQPEARRRTRNPPLSPATTGDNKTPLVQLEFSRNRLFYLFYFQEAVINFSFPRDREDCFVPEE
jgi:hypothetical protein